MRADQVEASWSVLDPILQTWAGQKPADFPNYLSGTWGPQAADRLIEKDGRSWLQPIPKEDAQGDALREST